MPPNTDNISWGTMRRVVFTIWIMVQFLILCVKAVEWFTHDGNDDVREVYRSVNDDTIEIPIIKQFAPPPA